MPGFRPGDPSAPRGRPSAVRSGGRHGEATSGSPSGWVRGGIRRRHRGCGRRPCLGTARLRPRAARGFAGTATDGGDRRRWRPRARHVPDEDARRPVVRRGPPRVVPSIPADVHRVARGSTADRAAGGTRQVRWGSLHQRGHISRCASHRPVVRSRRMPAPHHRGACGRAPPGTARRRCPNHRVPLRRSRIVDGALPPPPGPVDHRASRVPRRRRPSGPRAAVPAPAALPRGHVLRVRAMPVLCGRPARPRWTRSRPGGNAALPARPARPHAGVPAESPVARSSRAPARPPPRTAA